MTAQNSLTDKAHMHAALPTRAAVFAFAALVVLITAARIAALPAIPIGLYFDEAQYWHWSRSLDWGYYTKPPMIAWAIWATTSLFGDAEWAVRLAAPLAHAITASAIFALGRSIYGGWPGFVAGLAWLVMPAVWFSSALISTDALLLPFWALSLFFIYRLMATRAWVWAALAGLGIGFGLLAKYAMLYFPVCLVLAAFWLPQLRKALGGGRWALMAAIALALVAPNLLWNVQNNFATISHTADNANFSADLFNLDELGEFITSQIPLIGPLMFFAFVAVLWRAGRKPLELAPDDKFLLAFTLPPLVAVTTLAFVTRANGNWAVTAYVAATVLIVGMLWRGRFGRRWLAGALAVNVLIGAALIFAIFDPGLANRFRGVRDARGWDETAAAVAASVDQYGPVSAILVDDRTALFELNYYWTREGGPGAPAPLRMWLLHGERRNAADAAAPMQVQDGERVLVVYLTHDENDLVRDDFSAFRRIGEIVMPLGEERDRRLVLSIGEGFDPVPRDAAFRARLAAERRRR